MRVNKFMTLIYAAPFKIVAWALERSEIPVVKGTGLGIRVGAEVAAQELLGRSVVEMVYPSKELTSRMYAHARARAQAELSASPYWREKLNLDASNTGVN